MQPDQRPTPEPDRSRLFEALKKTLRARNITYLDLAARLGMSESGVKKIFSAEDCSLRRLEQICDAIHLSLAELLDLADRPAFEEVALSEAQQRALLDQPLLLHVYWKLLVERWTRDRTAQAFGLDRTAMRAVLDALDRLELITLEQPGDRVRLRHGDLVRWLPSGPLLEHLHATWGRDVLDRARAPDGGGLLRLHHIELRPDTRQAFEADLTALLDAYLRQARRERLTSREADAPPHSLLVALARGSFVRPDDDGG